MTHHNPVVYLLHMRDDASKALKLAAGHTRADFADEMFAFAMAFLVGRIDPTAAKVPAELREAYASVPWSAVLGVREQMLASEGMRNDSLVWSTLKVLPDLLSALEDALADLGVAENSPEDLSTP